MIRFIAIYFVILLIKIPLANSETINPTTDEKISTYCECLVGFSGCQLEFLASAAGKPIHSWTQENYLKKGIPADLSAACYRKRNDEGKGDGLCCEFNNSPEKTMTNLFRGTKQ